MILLLVFVLCAGGLGSASEAAEAAVRPLGAFPFQLPGQPAASSAAPRLLLWCHGAKLVGVVGQEAPRESPAATQKIAAPTAFLLRDGRCEADGSSVSFGFLVPMKAWVFESAARSPLEERTAWLLYRFAGATRDGVLKGTLVQVDVGHPGHPFRESAIVAERLPVEQLPFADEGEWLGSVARTFSLAPGGP